MEGLQYDAIIVGIGPAGAVIAEGLSGAGWKVLGLEEGPWYNPFRDFREGRAPRAPIGITFAPDNEVRPGIVKAVGGGMVFYAGVFFRLHDNDFHTRSRFACGADWPLNYQELAPYYDKVEIFTGASGSNTNIFEAPRGPYPNPPHPLSRGSHYFVKGAQACSFHPAITPVSILSRPYRGRPACTYCAKCGWGCMIGDKSSPEMTYVPSAVNNGADIRPGNKVITIETNRIGRVTGVVFKDQDGVMQKAGADLVVLCGGTILNPLILKRSRGPAHPDGLGARSGLVGRNLMGHVGGRYLARFPEVVNGYMGISGGANVQDFYDGPKDADFHRGYTIYVSLLPEPPESFAGEYLENWGDELVEIMNSYNRIIRLAILGEDQANPENCVIPDPEKKDEDGLPLVRVSYRRSENEIRLFRHAVETSRQICRAGGADNWEFYHDSNSTAHPLGTCRMGNDPGKSVVNRWGACHDVPGLYIMDSSVFPTSGAVNPALTIMALASRTADHLIKRRKG
jgi:choline dehydrogenase-like flavoprotein